MKLLTVFGGWCLLLVWCRPLAVPALVLATLVWSLWLSLRLLLWWVDVVFALLRALLFLPAHLFGYQRRL